MPLRRTQTGIPPQTGLCLVSGKTCLLGYRIEVGVAIGIPVGGSAGRSSANDPKLSDCGARRAGCGKVAGAGWATVVGWRAAASVTRGAVRCSAWFGFFAVGLRAGGHGRRWLVSLFGFFLGRSSGRFNRFRGGLLIAQPPMSKRDSGVKFLWLALREVNHGRRWLVLG